MSKPKVMVALRDKASIESLMELACQLTHAMGAELIALHVVVVPILTPIEVADETLDQPGKEVLAEAKRSAANLSTPLATELLRARESGEAIVGVAKEKGIDLLVIGHHKPHAHALGDTLVGGIARYAIHHAPCRVILQIPAPARK